MKYPENIMRNLRRRYDLEANDTSKDDLIMAQSKQSIIEDYFAWQGIIGYSYEIIKTVSDVYGLNIDI